MAEISVSKMPPPAPELSGKAAIVGVGESDYHADYSAARSKEPGYQPASVETLASLAFERALADSGLTRADIDGISVSFTYGGPSARDMAEMLGIKPRHAIENGNIMAGPLPVVCADIAAGKADTVVMIYAVASHSAARQFGGSTYGRAPGGVSDGTPYSYYYFHPWGWSSQAAHWAMMFRYYQSVYGVREEDLGEVAVQVRSHAAQNPNAVMQAPITIADYMASRYIVRPLHLFDLCLVNDGAVCLIVRRADMAKDTARVPVSVAGWGEAKIANNKMHVMVRERLRPQLQEAGAQAFAMAGLSLGDVQHFEGYDASTFHLVDQIEGFGFAPEGEGLAFCKDGQMGLGGRIPTNMSGGNLSGSYMHGWSQVVEAVRQLRGESGVRQIAGAEVSLSCLTQTDQAHPILYRRGV